MGAHAPNSTNGGIKEVASVATTDVRISAIVAIARDIAVAAGKTDNCDRSGVIRIVAVTVTVTVAAVIRRNHDSAAPAGPTALPAAPRGFGPNSQ